MTGQFTGRHMAAIMVTFFAVVVGVNLFMASLASSTFGGVVVENSYVASQHFNRWLDEAEAEDKLGWGASITRQADDRVSLRLSGAPAGAQAMVVARHPLGRLPDRALTFVLRGDGQLVSREVLPGGRWRLRLLVRAAGQQWRSEQDLP